MPPAPTGPTAANPPSTFTYSGNPDFRGFVAANAPEFLNFIGNDVTGQGSSGINTDALGKAGGVESPYMQQSLSPGAAVNAIDSLFGTFSQLYPAWYASQQGSGGSGSSSSSSSSGTTADPQTEAYYNDQANLIRDEIGNLAPQLAAGESNIGSAYNQQYNALTTAENEADQSYNTNRSNTTQDYLTARNNIADQVRQNTDGLMRLLGAAGSGNSSAAQFLAPYAAARAGSQQSTEAQTAYNRNLNALDTNWADTSAKYGVSFADLTNQKTNQQNALQASINNTRASLLQTLAGLTTAAGQAGGQNYTTAEATAQPYISQAEQLLGTVPGLSTNAGVGITATPVANTAPVLTGYDTAAPSISSSTPAGGGDVLPSYYPLLGGGQQQNNILTAGA